jgi:hypothetical protein
MTGRRMRAKQRERRNSAVQVNNQEAGLDMVSWEDFLEDTVIRLLPQSRPLPIPQVMFCHRPSIECPGAALAVRSPHMLR